ncbi:MAG: PTS sugar transporter subunit IIB [Sarcina sp.]
MVGVIIASHGSFAEGILESASMIFGEQENIKTAILMPSEGPDDIRKKVEQAIASFKDVDEVLFLVDLWGGTPFNQINSLFEENQEKWAILTGMNLPMVLEVLGARFSMDSAHEIAASVLKSSRDGVKARPEKLDVEEESVQKVLTKISNGGSPGELEYVLARIDSRLLHGQVATAWTKTTGPNRIIVVSDEVTKDELRKKLIQQAAPPGVKAHVIPIKQMIKIANDKEHFGGQKALLLFENPQDVLEAVKGGVPLKSINVGSMAHSVGKVQPNKTLAFNQEDVNTFLELEKLGLQFDVRKVPNDAKANMKDILKKAQSELNK